MSPHTLPRTGLPALTFPGAILAAGDSRRHQGPLQSRWQEVGLYSVEGGGYVGAVSLMSCWAGEEDEINLAFKASSLAGLAKALAAVDPLQGAYLPPPHNERLERQAEEIRRAVRLAYGNLLSALYAEAELEEQL